MENKFVFNTFQKLQKVFDDHCNLNIKQFIELMNRLDEMADNVRDGEYNEVFAGGVKLQNVIDFMLETEELNLKEHAGITDLANEIIDEAYRRREAVQA